MMYALHRNENSYLICGLQVVQDDHVAQFPDGAEIWITFQDWPVDHQDFLVQFLEDVEHREDLKKLKNLALKISDILLMYIRNASCNKSSATKTANTYITTFLL